MNSKNRIPNYLMNGNYQISISNTKDIAELKNKGKILSIQLEKIPERKKSILHILRIYFDIIVGAILSVSGLSFIFMEKDIKKAIIFLCLGMLFFVSPLIGRSVINKQRKIMIERNIIKIKEFL